MKLCVLCILLLLACMYPSLAQGSYENCCLSYNKQPRPQVMRKIQHYRVQETDGGCNIPAIIFTVKKLQGESPLCADPNMAWVKKIMKKVLQKPK